MRCGSSHFVFFFFFFGGFSLGLLNLKFFMGIKHTKIRSVPISAKIYCEIFLFDFVALLYLLLRVLNMEVQDFFFFFFKTDGTNR